MRARLAIAASQTQTHLREVVLRDKPQAFLEVSPSATVPCLVHGGGVIDESLDIMIWALKQNDPDGWLDMPAGGFDAIARNDGPFKQALDRTKYETRYPGENPAEQRDKACTFLQDLNDQMDGWIFGRATLADYAILPFVRQFAFIDKDWFDAQDWPQLQAWLARFLASDAFAAMMDKYPQWQDGDAPVMFPPA